MSFYPELDNLTLQELIKEFKMYPQKEKNVYYYEELAMKISMNGKTGVNLLKNEIKKSNTSRLQAIIFGLSFQVNDFEVKKILISHLNHKSSKVVASAIDGLSFQGAKDTSNEILKLLNHKSPYVIGSILRFIRKLFPENAFSFIIKYLNHSNFIVRENAIDELGELGDIRAIPLLYPLLTDKHRDVRQAAATAIDILESRDRSDRF